MKKVISIMLAILIIAMSGPINCVAAEPSANPQEALILLACEIFP